MYIVAALHAYTFGVHAHNDSILSLRILYFVASPNKIFHSDAKPGLDREPASKTMQIREDPDPQHCFYALLKNTYSISIKSLYNK